MGIHFSGCIARDNHIRGVSVELSAICDVHLPSGEVSVLKTLSDKNIFTDAMQYKSLVEINGKKIVYPLYGNDIIVYDDSFVEIGRIYIEWKDFTYSKNQREKVGNCIIKDQFLFFVGRDYPIIIKLDTETLVYKIIELDMEELKAPPVILHKNICQWEQKLFIPILNRAAIFIFDMISESYEVKEWNWNENGFADVAVCNDVMWLLSSEKNILYKVSGDHLEEFIIHDELGENLCDNQKCFDRMIFQNGFLWIFTFHANHLIQFNPDTKEHKSIKSGKQKYSYIGIFDENHIYAFYKYGEMVDMLDTIDGTIKSIPVEYPNNLKEYCVAAVESDNISVYEHVLGLKNYLDCISIKVCEKDKRDFTVGQQIYMVVGERGNI